MTDKTTTDSAIRRTLYRIAGLDADDSKGSTALDVRPGGFYYVATSGKTGITDLRFHDGERIEHIGINDDPQSEHHGEALVYVNDSNVRGVLWIGQPDSMVPADGGGYTSGPRSRAKDAPTWSNRQDDDELLWDSRSEHPVVFGKRDPECFIAVLADNALHLVDLEDGPFQETQA